MTELGIRLTDDGGLAITGLVSRAELDSAGLTPAQASQPAPTEPATGSTGTQPPAQPAAKRSRSASRSRKRSGSSSKKRSGKSG